MTIVEITGGENLAECRPVSHSIRKWETSTAAHVRFV
jgi:hypothetical protein